MKWLLLISAAFMLPAQARPIYRLTDLSVLGAPAPSGIETQSPRQSLPIGPDHTCPAVDSKSGPPVSLQGIFSDSGALIVQKSEQMGQQRVNFIPGKQLTPQASAIAPEDIGTLGGTWSVLAGANKNDWIAGTSETAGGVARAFIWRNGQMIDLGTLGGQNSRAVSINDAGVVIGYAEKDSGEFSPFFWKDGKITELFGFSTVLLLSKEGGLILGCDAQKNFIQSENAQMPLLVSVALPAGVGGIINVQGQIVGFTSSFSPYLTDLFGGGWTQDKSFFSQNGQISDVHRELGADFSNIPLISEHGHAGGWVGYVNTKFNDLIGPPFVRRPDGSIKIANEFSDFVSAGNALAINTKGHLTGNLISDYVYGKDKAYLIRGDEAFDLNELIDPKDPLRGCVELWQGNNINERDQIIVSGMDCKDWDKSSNWWSTTRDYLLTPGEWRATALHPVNSDGTSVFKKTSTVPLKFEAEIFDEKSCSLPRAQLKLEYIATAQNRRVNEQSYILATDSGVDFRVEGCMYSYNLKTNLLPPGNYLAKVVIDGEEAGSVRFSLRQ